MQDKLRWIVSAASVRVHSWKRFFLFSFGCMSVDLQCFRSVRWQVYKHIITAPHSICIDLVKWQCAHQTTTATTNRSAQYQNRMHTSTASKWIWNTKNWHQIQWNARVIDIFAKWTLVHVWMYIGCTRLRATSAHAHIRISVLCSCAHLRYLHMGNNASLYRIPQVNSVAYTNFICTKCANGVDSTQIRKLDASSVWHRACLCHKMNHQK